MGPYKYRENSWPRHMLQHVIQNCFICETTKTASITVQIGIPHPSRKTQTLWKIKMVLVPGYEFIIPQYSFKTYICNSNIFKILCLSFSTSLTWQIKNFQSLTFQSLKAIYFLACPHGTRASSTPKKDKKCKIKILHIAVSLQHHGLGYIVRNLLFTLWNLC